MSWSAALSGLFIGALICCVALIAVTPDRAVLLGSLVAVWGAVFARMQERKDQ